MGALGAPLVAAVIAPELHHRPAHPFLSQMNTNGAFKRVFEESRYSKRAALLGNGLSRRSSMSHDRPSVFHYPDALTRLKARLQ